MKTRPNHYCATPVEASVSQATSDSRRGRPEAFSKEERDTPTMDQEIFTFFRPGCAYAATHDFSRLGSKFSTGEPLRFRRAVFGVYDEVYFYEFDPVVGGGTKSWFPLKSEGEKDCARYFAVVEEKSWENRVAGGN